MILEGVHQGMGKHNDAIKDDDAKVAALMVCSYVLTFNHI